jgi:hypothetical protein
VSVSTTVAATERKLAGVPTSQIEKDSGGYYTRDQAGHIVPKAKAIAYQPGSTAPSPGQADVNAGLKAPSSSSHKGEIVPGEYGVPVLGTVSKGVTEVGEDIGGLINEGAEESGKKVAEGVVGLVKPIATKLTLYGVLIFGAVAMIVFGASELLKPVGGPDLAGKTKTAAKTAATGLLA